MNKKYLIIACIGVLLLVAAVSTSGYLYYQNQKLLLGQSSTKQEAKKEIDDLVVMVGKLMELPSGKPTVATVTDPSKLSGQAFFAHAKSGDKVLIYVSAKKAILYRPSTNKIVDVAPVNLDQPVTKALTVTINNGSQKAGLASLMEKKISSISGVSVVAKGNTEGVFDQTVIVDVEGKNSQIVQTLAKTLGVKVASLPEGEARPNSQILLIVGKDFD